MKLFGWTESINRSATIYAAYMSQTEGTFNEKMKKAHDISNDAHGVYSKANKPSFMRGGGIGANIIQMAYVFKTFSHNYMVTMLRLGFKEHQAKAATYMAMAPAMFGVTSAVGVNVLIHAIGTALGSDDPEEDFYRVVADNWGATPEKLMRFGLPGLVNVDMTGSLSIGITDLPTDMKGFIGAPGDVFVSIYKGVGDIGRGNIQKGFERIVPNAFGNISKGIREYTEGVTTKSNAPVFYEDEPLKADEIDAMLRIFSFNPAKISEARAKLWSEKKRKVIYQSQRSEIYARIKRFYLKRNRKKSDWMKIVALVESYNDDSPTGEKKIDIKKQAERIAKKMRRPLMWRAPLFNTTESFKIDNPDYRTHQVTINIVGSPPAGSQIQLMRKAAGSSVFLPLLIDGSPVIFDTNSLKNDTVIISMRIDEIQFVPNAAFAGDPRGQNTGSRQLPGGNNAGIQISKVCVLGWRLMGWCHLEWCGIEI